MENRIFKPIDIQKSDDGFIRIGDKIIYMDGGVSTYRDIFDTMQLVGKEILPEEVNRTYNEILSVGMIFIRGLR